MSDIRRENSATSQAYEPEPNLEAEEAHTVAPREAEPGRINPLAGLAVGAAVVAVGVLMVVVVWPRLSGAALPAGALR